MQASKRYKGEFILPHPPINFRHKHLSLQKQRKDKEIKNEREELQKRRKQYEQSKSKWIKQELQFKLYSAKRREENMNLIMQEEKLKADLFRLATRRDQIQSRTNPQISIQKAQLIKKYLRCVSYTAGKRLECIQFWKSQPRYNQLKFLLELAVDRFFGRSQRQKCIISNLSRIVFCKKIKFEAQWIMMCIKEPQESSSNYCEKTSKKSHRSIYHPENANSNKEFQLTVYAITGTYFSIRKTYHEQQLRQWAQNTNENVILKPVVYSHRLSVADNLAKINALKELSQNLMMTPEVFRNSTRKDSINSIQDAFKIISQQAVHSSHNSQLNEEQQECTANQIEKKSSSSNNEQSQQSKNATDDNLSDANQSENQVYNNTKLKTRKSVHSKSSFYIKDKNQTFICKFNRSFLSGIQQVLFPQQSPIINLIVLKDKQQIFLLQEYIQLQNKKQILDKAVARFRLKMKIKAEQKKCLYYKIITVTSCYETVMAQEEMISLPCLFVVKSHETPQANELIISCDSLLFHPKIQNGLQIKALLHQTLKEKDDSKQLKIVGRTSNMKNGKNSNLRRSRQSKRKQNLRNPSRNLSIQQHQKSVFGNLKKIVEPWVAFSKQIIDKFTLFMSMHLISIQKKQFISRQWVKKRIFSIIRIQNKIRSTISKRKFNKAKEVTKIKCAWRPNSKILVTATLNINDKTVRVYFQIVEIRNKELVRTLDYGEQNWEAICLSLACTPEQGTFRQVSDNLITIINQNIEIQTQKKMKLQAQKPQKYRRMISNFFFMISLRNRVKKNIFFIKKLIIRQRMFVLLIRRDSRVKSLLQCHLYDVLLQKTKEESKQIKNSETAFSKQQKELGSEYGSHKPPSRSKPELDDKIFRYQKIYLMEQYFQNIDHKRIIDQFYIEKGVFLLKPPKTVNVYYIDRLNALDLNSQEFAKEYGVYEREENILKINQDRISLNVSNKSLKRLIHQNISDKTEKNQTQSRQLLNNISRMKCRKQSKQNSKKEKKTSIQQNERELIKLLKSNFMKENAKNMQTLSKKSFGQSNSGKSGRQVYQIKNNSQQSIVYYSLYKSENVFFYLELFIVKRTFHESAYHQQLVSIEKYRLYKKQLEQANISLFYKKLAQWAHQNDDQFIKGQEAPKDKNDNSFKNDETVSNLVTLEFFNALIGGNKRFSCEIQNNSPSQKGPRTNTLTL